MANRRKGPDFEILFQAWLSTFKGLEKVYRMPRQGIHDKGDIGGVPDSTVELKATQSFSLTGLKEAEKEASNAGNPWFFYVWKWAGHSAHRSVVSTYAQVWAEVMEELCCLRAENEKLRFAIETMKGGGS